jgi:hypothetical protein
VLEREFLPLFFSGRASVSIIAGFRLVVTLDWIFSIISGGGKTFLAGACGFWEMGLLAVSSFTTSDSGLAIVTGGGKGAGTML